MKAILEAGWRRPQINIQFSPFSWCIGFNFCRRSRYTCLALGPVAVGIWWFVWQAPEIRKEWNNET